MTISLRPKYITMERPMLSVCGVWLLVTLFALPVFAHTASQQKQVSDKLIYSNLHNLKIPFPARCSTKIKRLVWEQLTLGRRETEKTLGRSAVYFPVFEYFLEQYNLPEELKYIPFVESRMKIRAESPAGAKGLWQFMDYTAVQYKLKVNDSVDERFDLVRSTEAAARLLDDLYGEFGDWLLVLAAYNCGPGRVRRAIRQAGSDHYWDLEQYLPRQTQGYIPSFISAVYVVEYYEQHGLHPKKFRHSFQALKALKLSHFTTLRAVAATTGLPLHTVRQLNPGYQQEIIPASSRGNYLVLPDSAMLTYERALFREKIGFERVEPFSRELSPERIALELMEFPPVTLHKESWNAGFSWQFLIHPQKTFLRKISAIILNPLILFQKDA